MELSVQVERFALNRTMEGLSPVSKVRCNIEQNQGCDLVKQIPESKRGTKGTIWMCVKGEYNLLTLNFNWVKEHEDLSAVRGGGVVVVVVNDSEKVLG